MRNTFTFILRLILLGALLAACQSATPTPTATPEPTAIPTEIPQPWQTVTEFNPLMLMTLPGFNDSTFGIYIGDDSRLMYSEDGGVSWQDAQIDSSGLYGLDIVDRNTAWVCGNRTTRVTTDGGKTWQVAANFGDNPPVHCRFVSFLDSKTGWAATSTQLVATSDGAVNWTNAVLPQGVEQIAAISLYASGNGCLLDTQGNVFSTKDDGKSWTKAGMLPLDDLTIATMSPPVAAMRFQNAGRGVVIIPAVVDGAGRTVAFQTYDGGRTWKRQPVADSFGYPVISHDGRILTLYSVPTKVAVLQYIGQ
jgi:photosystem II stability/assembly factor-like uncharacterized protein